MQLLNIQSSPRRSRSASIAVADAFLEAYRQVCPAVIVDTLNVWDEKLPEFDQETFSCLTIATSFLFHLLKFFLRKDSENLFPS